MHCKDTILRTQNNWPYSKLIPNSGYNGMTPEKIDIQTPTSYATNWIVSMDGKTFTQKSTGGSTGDATIQKRMPFTIKTLNDDYVLVYMEGWEDMGGNKNISEIDASMLWMQCDGEKGR